MSSPAGDRFTIRIGGDASGTVVAGHENRVEIHHSPEQPETATEPDRETGPSQTTTVRDHGTAYTVMKGELHIHADPPARPPAAD
ncbi:hypothetical protein [Streptomyces carpaticus]|uniref:Uncharacterized protein n=1 Tax=Streptomyces carpaticus TaxID=285558 RepID=A0ABV4ZPZ0_9ACTN